MTHGGNARTRARLEERGAVDIGPWRVVVAVGSLVDVAPVDALVSSDDNYLSHGGGVSAAVWAAAGPELAADAALARLSAPTAARPAVGDVVTSGAGRLPALHLLHAITLDFDRGTRLDQQALERLLRNVLAEALARGARSLALPLVGTGAAGIPSRACAEAFASVLELTPAPWDVAVHLVVRDGETAEVALQSLKASAELRRRYLGEQDGSPVPGEASLPALWAAAAVRALRPAASPDAASASPLRSAAERVLGGSASDRYADARALLRLLAESPEDPEGQFAPPFAGVGGGEGTRAVRALKNLISSAGDAADVRELVSRLRASGYRGRKDDDVLLEYCASEDPVEVLQELFPAARLRRLLGRHTGDLGPAGERPEDVYRRALRALDFPVTPVVVDPQSLLRHVRSLRVEAAHCELPRLRGEISRVCTDLEVLLRMLLKFVSRDAFGLAPEVLLVDAGQATSAAEVGRASLGKLVSFLRHVDGAVSQSSDARAARVQEHLAERRLLTRGTEEVPALRNRWSHAKDGESVTVHDARRDVARLCDLVEELLLHWTSGEWTVFPSVVVVQEINRDRYGRVKVVARRSDGVVEQLFTDDEVVTGSTYLARRLTNPLSVDPVLVPLGDSAGTQ